MPRPSVLIATPYAARANNGNWRTAARWSRMLRDRYRLIVQAHCETTQLTDGDILIALHARRSHAVVRAWHERFADRPIVVVLTGTDLYRDLPADPDARDSLELADRLVVLQEDGIQALPREHRGKARVVYQSASSLSPAGKPHSRFNCIFVGHLREEKDPLTALRAFEQLPGGVPVYLTMVGEALDRDLGAAAKALQACNPRFQWLGARPHGWTRQAIKHAHLLIVPSRMEGGANVIVEAVTSGTPVLASRVPGNVGMLGPDYAGYFALCDASSLGNLILRCRGEPQLYRLLERQCRARRALFAPSRERSALMQLMRELVPDA
jgi:putative glycosyltransferase (TIGR04348 family)